MSKWTGREEVQVRGSERDCKRWKEGVKKIENL